MSRGATATGHNLSRLFQRLTPWHQNEIIKAVGLDRDSFMEDLVEMSEAFVQWRYVYDYSEVKISIGFLDKLARATQEAARSAVSA